MSKETNYRFDDPATTTRFIRRALESPKLRLTCIEGTRAELMAFCKGLTRRQIRAVRKRWKFTDQPKP